MARGPLDVRGKFFTDRVVKYCNRLPRKAEDDPSPEVLKEAGWGAGQSNIVLHPVVGKSSLTVGGLELYEL